ncbi:MAG: MBL fold metallo-hydrolase [Clostridia bacterium]
MSVYVETIVLDLFQTNCYVIHDGTDAVIIDAGTQPEDIIDVINSKNLNLKAILLTHGHHDHVRATTLIKKEKNVKIYIHKEDEEFLLDPPLIHGGGELETPEYIPAKADEYLEDNQELTFGSLKFKVIHIQGHSNGSCCFICDNYLFTGDSMLKGRTGRIDLYKSDKELLHKSLKTKIYPLEKNYIIMPGHRENSTLFVEKETNPCFK